MKYAIIADNLVKKYGDCVAVRGVSFKVKKGEIFAFLGPNGAGKTTTIHILTTLLKPTSGRAIVAGYDVVKAPNSVRKRIGVVFQDPSLDRELTAYENMYIHGKIYGLSGKELNERIIEMLRFVELEKFKDKQVKFFSGGMRRRLEIARALVHYPEILFLDEPTLGLDPQTRAHIWEYIKKLKEEHKMTIFLTTHYMDEAEQLADRVAIIDRGRIIAEGTVEDLKKIIGSDVIYVKALNNGQKMKRLNSNIIKGCEILRDGTIRLEVVNAIEALPKIFEFAQKENIKILEVMYHRPTLNDVFLYLTGRELREENAIGFDMVRMVRGRYMR